MAIKIETSNLEKITKKGYSYIKRDYFDNTIHIYAKDNERIVYNPEEDLIILRYTK